MVRHEAAEALGAILEEGAGDSEADQIIKVLRQYAEDASAPRVARESCIVALDEIAYNQDPSQFQRVE